MRLRKAEPGDENKTAYTRTGEYIGTIESIAYDKDLEVYVATVNGQPYTGAWVRSKS